MSDLDRLVSEGVVGSDVPVAQLTTYRLGGPARYLAEVDDPDVLDRVWKAWKGSGLPVLVIGRGSNLVVSDHGFEGLAIRLGGRFAHISVKADEVVAAGAASLPALARATVKAGRLGLEFFVGIPGSVGGAVRQNAGCHGVETKEVLEWAEVFDLETGETERLSPTRLDLSYRHSNVRASQVVIGARFFTFAGEVGQGEAKLREITRWRREHQPGGTYNAGSVFKNPTGDHAGRLIDSLGLKGLAVGGASVSHRHANFFEATVDATAQDLHRLVRVIQGRVFEATGIRLEPEVVFVGRFDD